MSDEPERRSFVVDAPTPARSLFVGFFRLALEGFYRLTHLGGEVPREGPVLLVGNHPNGLLDPIVLARVARRPVRPLAKAPLFRMPIIGPLVRIVGALPIYRAEDGDDASRNHDTFSAVEDALLEGACVCMFPEGASHDEERVLPLKTGAARMALGAAERAHFESDIAIVPVGIIPWEKEHFRGEIATLVGKPIYVDDWSEEFAVDPRRAARTLTLRIEEALQKVTLDLEKREDRPVLAAVDALWPSSDNERMRRIKVLAR